MAVAVMAVLPVAAILVATGNVRGFLDAHPVMGMWIGVSFLAGSLFAVVAVCISLAATAALSAIRLRLGCCSDKYAALFAVCCYSLLTGVFLLGLIALIRFVWNIITDDW